jgi:aryl-alcohol dehydrogenase-like predicted oxidoreductase
MDQLVRQGSIRLTGASSVSETLIEKALAYYDPQALLWPDVIQTGAWLPFKRPDLAEALWRMGKVIVINSPIRMKPAEMSDHDALTYLSNFPWISFVLTGTRRHLQETVNIFKNS